MSDPTAARETGRGRSGWRQGAGCVMLTQHRGYRTRSEGLQGNPELDVMEEVWGGGGEPGARDAKAGRKERAAGGEEGWGG